MINQENSFKKGVIGLTLVSFFLAFNYFILRSLKETFLVTAPQAGAEAIPFVKTWFLFPLSLVFIWLFTWMVGRFSFRLAVSTLITFFLSSYAFFAFFCFPIRESLHLHVIADHLQEILPIGWKGFAAVVRYWSYSLFYVMAECWCTMIYSVVFWGYANAVMKLGDAKKYYPFLTLAGTIAALLAGPLTIFITGKSFEWETAFYLLIASVLLSGSAALFLFWFLCPAVEAGGSVQEKTPIRHSFLKVFRSKYLMTVALICLSLNLAMNLTDVVWKNEVVKLYPEPQHFTSYLSQVTFLTGIVSTIFTLFISRPMLKWYGWTKVALLTPYLVVSTGLLFFVSIYFQRYFLDSATIAFFGSIHVILSCSAKYTLFEPTKEMAFIPLSSEDKLHGKAVIDGVSARLGRTSSSLTYQLLLISLPTIAACTPIIGVFLFLIMAGCITAIISLGKQLKTSFTPVNS